MSTDDLIDKLARALQRLTWRGPLPEWEDTPAHIKDALRDDASAILSAVADDLRAEAFDRGAEYGWLQTGEGFNGEYANGTTHDGTIALVEAMGDDYANPYRQEQSNE